MKKYMLLRFFILCSCIISNIQVFAMKSNTITTVNITGQIGGIGWIGHVGGNMITVNTDGSVDIEDGNVIPSASGKKIKWDKRGCVSFLKNLSYFDEIVLKGCNVEIESSPSSAYVKTKTYTPSYLNLYAILKHKDGVLKIKNNPDEEPDKKISLTVGIPQSIKEVTFDFENVTANGIVYNNSVVIKALESKMNMQGSVKKLLLNAANNSSFDFDDGQGGSFRVSDMVNAYAKNNSVVNFYNDDVVETGKIKYNGRCSASSVVKIYYNYKNNILNTMKCDETSSVNVIKMK